ncbi:DUF2514 family protein [Pseudomonas aeruginosa]|uniref:DUF2514 family protein n=1 Tax=Pseudomonas aeruginosa TaxID=287 RepID=UPI003B5260A7
MARGTLTRCALMLLSLLISVRDVAAKYADRIAAAEASRDSCTAAASKAAASTLECLPTCLERLTAWRAVYAEAADESRVRGLACEAAYEGVRGPRRW